MAILDMPPERPPSSSKSVQSPSQGKLFEEKLVPAQPNSKSGQSELLDTEFIPAQNAEPDKENFVLASKVLSPNQIRDRLVTMIYKDLLGPSGGEFEEVDEPSLTERYLVGAIAPGNGVKKARRSKKMTPPNRMASPPRVKKTVTMGTAKIQPLPVAFSPLPWA
ncbi:hypothetical protein NON20_26315 (plasmid) [Synechocystis sp. B12]|nr:hypothetical protein NON20_26315 [Synechocystis sp. B12]